MLYCSLCSRLVNPSLNINISPVLSIKTNIKAQSAGAQRKLLAYNVVLYGTNDDDDNAIDNNRKYFYFTDDDLTIIKDDDDGFDDSDSDVSFPPVHLLPALDYDYNANSATSLSFSFVVAVLALII